MVIKTAYKPKGASLPSKRPFSSVYYAGRKALQYYGYYDKYNLRRYDPEVYFEKYRYKPLKRTAGYLGRAIHARKTRSILRTKRVFGNQQHQERSFNRNCWCSCHEHNSVRKQSSKYSAKYDSNRSFSRFKNISNMGRFYNFRFSRSNNWY